MRRLLSKRQPHIRCAACIRRKRQTGLDVLRRAKGRLQFKVMSCLGRPQASTLEIADVRKVGKQLGVTHVLEGSVRKDGKRVRIVQLVDGKTGVHVWAERFDRSGTDP